MRRTLFTDADNTLWDTNAVYAGAQLALLREVESICDARAPTAEDEGLAYLRLVDDEIKDRSPDRQGYAPRILARALQLALSGASPKDAAQLALRDQTPDPSFRASVERFTEGIKAVPHLRTGVRKGLTALHARGVRIVVVTESRRERCMATLNAHGLAEFILAVFAGRKTIDLYRRLRPPGRPMMVGDQVDCDVGFPQKAGYETVLYPGGYQPSSSTTADAEPDYRIERYDDVVPLLDRG